MSSISSSTHSITTPLDNLTVLVIFVSALAAVSYYFKSRSKVAE